MTLTGVESGHAVSVVETSLVMIVENFVGFADRLELDLGRRSLRLSDLIWMTGKGCLGGISIASEGS